MSPHTAHILLGNIRKTTSFLPIGGACSRRFRSSTSARVAAGLPLPTTPKRNFRLAMPSFCIRANGIAMHPTQTPVGQNRGLDLREKWQRASSGSSFRTRRRPFTKSVSTTRSATHSMLPAKSARRNCLHIRSNWWAMSASSSAQFMQEVASCPTLATPTYTT